MPVWEEKSVIDKYYLAGWAGRMYVGFFIPTA